MLDVLSIGEAKIDIFLQLPEDDPHFNLDSEKENLLLSYGKKIDIENYQKALGGNASNTAVGLARLEKQVGICAEVGNDEFSSFILNTLEKENLNINLLKKNDKPTPFSVILNYIDERTILSEHIKRDYNFSFEHTTAKLIYLTSLGDSWTSVYEDVLELIQNTDKVLAFNPGTLQIADRGHLIMDLIRVSRFLFVNKEEAEVLLYGRGKDLDGKDEDVKKLLFGLKGIGAKNVIITDAENGIFAVDENDRYMHLEIIKVKVIEKTGAGDSFNAGFLAAILENKSIEEALIWGSLNAASVIQKIGAQNGLLNKEELRDKLTTIGNYKTSSF
jgi:ribokinase